MPDDCRVYWGSHGCELERGHAGPHECDCCECPDHAASNVDDDGVVCVGKPPFYGPDTPFYGEDAPSNKFQELARRVTARRSGLLRRLAE